MPPGACFIGLGAMELARRRAGWPGREMRLVFFFFSNRLGCLGSIAVSAGLTLILLLVFGVI